MTKPRVETNEEQLIGGYTGNIFLSLSIGWIGIQISRQILPPLLPAIMTDLNITPFKAGVGLTALAAMYSLIHYPGGRLSDELNRKTVYNSGLIFIIIGSVILSLAYSYTIFLIGVIIIGGGSGAFFIAMRSITADFFETKRSLAFGIQIAFGNIGSAASAGLAVLAVAFGSWRNAFLPLALFFVLTLIVLQHLDQANYTVQPVDFQFFETMKRLFGSKSIRVLLVCYILFILVWNGVIGFLPTYLHAEKGIGSGIASAAFAIIFLVGIIVSPIAGNLGDYYERLNAVEGSLVFSIVGLTLITVYESIYLLSAGIVLFSMGLWAFPPVMQAYIIDDFDENNIGGDFGAFKTIYAGVGSLGPSYVGVVASRWNYTFAFAGMVIFLVLSLGVISIISRSKIDTITW